MCMPSYSKYDVILVRYPFSDLSSSKVRPAVIVSTSHPSQDILITPLTSKTGSLMAGEFVLSEWAAAGLNVATAVKRGVYTVHESLVIKVIGQLSKVDADQLEQSLRDWLGL
jgi:mRNA interferase MazF